MGQTYYDVLEVDPEATSAEIRTAYRERVLETHPDHNDVPDAADQFKRVSTARSVLTDGTERARYDRLGHGAYVRLAERSSGTNSPDSRPPDGDVNRDVTASRTTRSGTETASSDRSSSTTSRGSADETTAGHDRRGNRSRTRTGSGRTHSRGESSRRNRAGSRDDRTENRDGRTESHHARQRARRQRKTAQQRASGGWTFVTEGGRDSSHGSSSSNAASSSGEASPSGATGTANGTGGATSATGTGSASAAGASRASITADTDASSGFRYAVHDWEGEVDLEWEGQAITQTTAVTIGCLWLLYPLFVAASVTPLFPLVINAIVAACTLAFVGYLLTGPRIATAVFGFWSVLFPLGIDQLASVPAFSITGLVALGFVWVPFGYAVALWWALRP